MPETSSFFDSQTVPLGRLTKSLPELVAGQLLAAVSEGALEPGARLKEETLAEKFGVSRSTVREAIALLERRGIVERVARYGARIAVVDAGEIEEIFNIRAQLLGLAARVAAQRGSEDLLADLRSRASTLLELAADESTAPDRYAAASIDTQRVLVSANGHKRLASIYEDMSSLGVWRYAIREKSISFRTPQRRRESADDWQRLINAVLARDSEAAERFAKALLHASYLAVREQWSELSGNAAA